MIALLGPEKPDGANDHRLYDGLDGILEPFDLQALISTLVFSIATVTRDSLLSMGEMFGESRSDTEQAVSRAIEAGDIEIDAHGVARAVGSHNYLLKLHRRARSHPSPVWDGSWVMIMFPDGLDAEQVPDEVRRLVTGDRLRELRPGVWLRPENLGTSDRLSQAASSSQGYFPAVVQLERPRQMASQLWQMSVLADRMNWLTQAAESFIDKTEGTQDEHAPQGWILLSAIAFQLGLDPLLPPALLPSPWGRSTLSTVGLALVGHMQESFADSFKMDFPTLT